MRKYDIIILNEVDDQIENILKYIYKETFNKKLVKDISDIMTISRFLIFGDFLILD